MREDMQQDDPQTSPSLSPEAHAAMVERWRRVQQIMRRIHEFYEGQPAPTEKKVVPPHLLETFK